MAVRSSFREQGRKSIFIRALIHDGAGFEENWGSWVSNENFDWETWKEKTLKSAQ